MRFHLLICFCLFFFTATGSAQKTNKSTVIEEEGPGYEERCPELPKSRKMLNDFYSKDAKHIYFESSDYCGTLPEADPKSFQFLSPTEKAAYTKDSKRVYFYHHLIYAADPKTIVQLGERYAKDAQYVFHMENVLPGVDLKSFSAPYPNNVWYAKDKNHVYDAGKIIPGADPETFTVFNPDKSCGPDCTYRAQDKNHKYNWDDKVVQ